MIYAYTMPGVAYREGWIKIGQTSNDPQKRIAEQTRTAGIRTKLEWQDYAIYKDGSGQSFTDKQFHAWLVDKKGVAQLAEKDSGTELFKLDPSTSHDYFCQFASREIPVNKEQSTYILRREQQEAVDKTRAWFESGNEDQEFLWNAKPRFGKTLTSYALVQQMGFKKVLVVSNRPSISNSWAEDFFKFIGWQKQYSFVSDNDALRRRPGVITRRQFLDNRDAPGRIIAFESLQGLKNSIYFGGNYDSLKWISELEFDLLIVDESHEGVATLKTERAFENIKRKHTLYLSGTPFRQLASAQFGADQIFNWSYADEQQAKATWTGAGINPYERLPRLCLFTYQMSEIIRDKAQKGIIIEAGEGAVDYAFDLNEFFLTTENGRFAHEEDVRKFIRALHTQKKYPFSSPELRKSLAHTMWYLNRIASAKALEKLLKEDEVFREYEIVVAAGKNDEDPPSLKSYDKVKKAIADHDRTITLTVGQLTVGVTIPEWSAVLMLCNLASPASYMQAAFRAQNPCYELDGGELLIKENAYVFDFDPARTLVILDDFACNLSPPAGDGAGAEREQKLRRLLNFLPVIGEDANGEMVELDATEVLSIPRRLKSQEVVKHGFMSNFLFQNISNIFSAPRSVRQIIEKLNMASEEKRTADPGKLKRMGELPVDSEGNVEIPDEVAIGQAQGLFGAKIYGMAAEGAKKSAEALAAANTDELSKKIAEIGRNLKEQLATAVIAPIGETMQLSRGAARKIAKKSGAEIDRKIEIINGKYEQEKKIAAAAYEKEKNHAASAAEREASKSRYEAALANAAANLKKDVEATVLGVLEEAPAAIFKTAGALKADDEKRTIENEFRARLRGFSRTIPSFLMAYGDRKLKLSNIESYVDKDIFREVAGISVDEFLYLRDGGEFKDENTGQTENFAGCLFDEIVFNDAIQEFLNKKEELKDHFREDQEEDIFYYIPPQKTNQIFTPRPVVTLMVDMLEQENPGCFDDPARTFADLYMKSGMYITEIVKRLFRSEGMKSNFPDEKKRIRHILTHQVYGLAPSDIIYRIATNYILGFDDDLKTMAHNFRTGDALAAAKTGKLSELIDEKFGDRTTQ